MTRRSVSESSSLHQVLPRPYLKLSIDQDNPDWFRSVHLCFQNSMTLWSFVPYTSLREINISILWLPVIYCKQWISLTLRDIACHITGFCVPISNGFFWSADNTVVKICICDNRYIQNWINWYWYWSEIDMAPETLKMVQHQNANYHS